jgi:hypothetical protein
MTTMRLQRKALMVASAIAAASGMAATTARVAMAGDGDAERCPGQKLPLCREVTLCNPTLHQCNTEYYYFPGGGEE